MKHHELSGNHFDVLDGWRAVSILIVLATHLLPIGPKSWHLNLPAGVAGMAIFFTLSGFLITGFLLKHDSVVDFLIRRLFRVVPLAWVGIAVALTFSRAAPDLYAAHFLFYANLPPFWLTDLTAHFWSLCVEMQFYACVALLFSAFGTRGLWLLLPVALAVTLGRAVIGSHVSIVTWLRIDEILAGCVLSLVFNRYFGQKPFTLLCHTNPYLLLAAFLFSCDEASGPMNYLRPYLAAGLVGSTLVQPRRLISRCLIVKWMKYVAKISFALYVIHPLLGATWFGSGERIEKYLKRPLLFAVLFALAHLSTFSFERRCIAYGNRFSSYLQGCQREPG